MTPEKIVVEATTGKIVPGPVAGTRITESYVRLVARDAYFWAWPLVNVYSRRQSVAKASQLLRVGHSMMPPLNRMAMLTDYIPANQRKTACANQDVIYGTGVAALDQSPVVVQVPDFEGRFWMYQVSDLRTDSIANLGAMHGTRPGFYLVAGPAWNGEIPQGIVGLIRASTHTAKVSPRVYLDDTPEDKRAVQEVLRYIGMYPLEEFDGTMKRTDWGEVEQVPGSASGEGERQWVIPESFLDQLPLALEDAPPLPGEEARYAQTLAMVAAVQKSPELKAAAIDELRKADCELISPLLQFSSFGLPLADHWTTIRNGAAFGTDYFTRTAVARSNIFVNKQEETSYFYQDLDEGGKRLNGARRYTVTFTWDRMPPARGFWSLTLYNQHHFFVPNALERYSVGTKSRELRFDADGSLTIYVQAQAPADPAQHTNWLPAPSKEDFSLYLRLYWPGPEAISGRWSPPAVRVAN